MLQVRTTLPPGILELEASELHGLLGGPTLIHLPGARPEPLYVSCLLHGNETTGWLAVRELLRAYPGPTPLPRALSLFIGNVAAATHGLRRLDDQPDFNRIWKGGSEPEHALAEQVLAEMRGRGVFAAIDVHNNTGLNPHYACVNLLDNRYLHLARLFGRTVVYFIRPDTVSSLAFAGLCPSVTLECGQPGQAHGTRHVLEYLDAALRLDEHPVQPLDPDSVDLFHTTARIELADGITACFEQGQGDVWFSENLDHLNFNELPAGTTFGWARSPDRLPLVAWDESGADVAARFFEISGGEIRTRMRFMPSMLTRDLRIVRQDCLGYAMERYRVPGPAA